MRVAGVAALLLVGCHRHCGEPASRIPDAAIDDAATDADRETEGGIPVEDFSREVMRHHTDKKRDWSSLDLDFREQKLARAEREGFRPINDFADLSDGKYVRSDSERWASRFLRPEASSYGVGLDVKRSVVNARPGSHASDFLRHEYSTNATDPAGGIAPTPSHGY
jgi:hypothetical protein